MLVESFFNKIFIFKTVPFINAAVKNEKKLASSAHTPSMEKAYNPSEEPYNLLPSTRRLKAASISPVIYEYDEVIFLILYSQKANFDIKGKK